MLKTKKAIKHCCYLAIHSSVPRLNCCPFCWEFFRFFFFCDVPQLVEIVQSFKNFAMVCNLDECIFVVLLFNFMSGLQSLLKDTPQNERTTSRNAMAVGYFCFMDFLRIFFGNIQSNIGSLCLLFINKNYKLFKGVSKKNKFENSLEKLSIELFRERDKNFSLC